MTQAVADTSACFSLRLQFLSRSSQSGSGTERACSHGNTGTYTMNILFVARAGLFLKSGVSACPSFFIRHRGTSEVGLVPPITSVFRRQNSATQCAHEGSICVGGCVSRVHVHGKRTGARSKSEKATENIERHCQKRPTVFSFQICFLGSA